MSAQPNLQKFSDALGEEESHGKESLATGEKVQPRKEKMITSTRVEFGFFIRKIVNGVLVLYKQFPPAKDKLSAGTPVAFALKPADATGAAGQGGGTDLAGDPVVTETGGVAGEDDGGPIQGTRYEIGLFVGTTKKTTSDA